MKKLLNLLVGLCGCFPLIGQTKPAVHPLVDSIYQQWQRTRGDSQRGMPKDTFYYLPAMLEGPGSGPAGYRGNALRQGR